MSVSFGGVKSGDRVKLTRENGDELTFTVKAHCGTSLEDRYGNEDYYAEWDALEVLEVLPKPLPTGRWALVVPPEGRDEQPYLRDGQGWKLVGVNGVKSLLVDEEEVQNVIKHNGFTVAFEGVEDV